MPKNGLNVSLNSYDDIFSTEETRQEEQREQVQQIPIDELYPFKDHPFKVLDDEAMQRTVESIKQLGVTNPLIARPRPDGGYEIISGHRRQHAAQLARLKTLPVIVRDMSDDAAVLLMVDSTRKEMGLRPFSLSKLKPANQYQAHTAKLMEFQNFCFAYKKREPESLHIPSAELPVGETIAIIGLNGAGKSTLARCICGLEKKCGLLQVDGKTLDWKARLKHCYMVMQDTSHQLFTESVTDEVLLSMDNEDETVADEILKQFDLLEYKDRHPLSLSGGQKQRVAIASAIVSNREIIVFDEPTSGLDLKHMREVARSLKSLADQGKTLLVITHDPELVMAGCSYVVHMEKGQIKESYPLDESGSKKVLDFFRIRQ